MSLRTSSKPVSSKLLLEVISNANNMSLVEKADGDADDEVKKAEVDIAGDKDSNIRSFDYDIIVIGGGSGGLSASKEAAMLGKKVAVCDFVKPSPAGSSWGLGGTCVNVGCIPKKLMHQAALLGEAVRDAKSFGWGVDRAQVNHDWAAMVTEIQNHISGLNWGYRVALREKQVTYLNAYAEFVDKNTLKVTDQKGKERVVTAAQFILATGGRPRYPDIPGQAEGDCRVQRRHRVRGGVQHSHLRHRPGRLYGKHGAGDCGRGAQPQEREGVAQRAGADQRGQHLRRR